jgi:hypothetical protein
MIELSIEKRKKYKSDKKIKSEIEKRQKQIEKQKLSIERKKLLAIEKFTTAQTLKSEKKIARIIKNKQRKLDIFIRKEKNLKPLKNKENVKLRAKKAKAEICKYSKLFRADEN